MTQLLTDVKFSIIRGGLLERILILLRITTHDKPHTLRKIIFFTVIGWIPLLILSAAEGLLWGEKVEVTFLEEFATHIRILIAIPIMLLSEVLVDTRVKVTLNQFTHAGLVTESGKVQFELAKQKADRMCDSIWAEAVILGLIVINVIFRIATNNIGLTTWAFPDSADLQVLSLAGYWVAFVSLPLFQFFVLRWLWRWIIWFRLLILISKIDLELHPAHHDKAGGLGFLGEPPVIFGPITFMLGVVFAAMMAERILFLDFKMQEYYPLIAAFAILAVIINVVPLLSFVGPISLSRRIGIFEYSTLITNHHRSFDKKWIGGQDENVSLLGSADVSSASDLGVLYEAVRQMKPFPFDIKIMFATVVFSLLPLLPVLALQIPVAEIFEMLIGILL